MSSPSPSCCSCGLKTLPVCPEGKSRGTFERQEPQGQGWGRVGTLGKKEARIMADGFLWD